MSALDVEVKKEPVLVTGVAGFIGFHLARRLLQDGGEVVGVDNLNDYYDVRLKEARLAQLEGDPHFHFIKADLADRQTVENIFQNHEFPVVLHMAAQAGVRYSLKNPHAYVNSNLVAFVNILEGCRHHNIKHFMFASSSSVYGANVKIPFSIHDSVDHPLSLYAATKRSGELMAHVYAHLFNLPCTGLRFFTVYGPWGRPDMSPFLFTHAILEGRPIELFNEGQMKRDFTYIDDVVEWVMRLMEKIPYPASSPAPYRIFNLGHHRPVDLIRWVDILEKCLGKKAIKKLVPMHPADLPTTYAEIDDLIRETGYEPKMPLDLGVERFISWYREYYGIGGAV